MVEIGNISSGLVQKEDGIWYASSNAAISYPEEGNERCAQVEDTSFWFKHRNDCIVALVKSFPPSQGGSIFDVGGGNGFVSMGLVASGFEVVLIEPGPVGAQVAMERGLNNVVCSTLQDAKFSAASLPAVGLFDVVEHIEEDFSFLRTVNALLTEGGRIYITVPAYSLLWSVEDDSAGHYRRYTVRSLTNLLASAGFKVEFSTYIFRFLPLPIFLLRSIPSRIGFARRGDQRLSRDHASGNSRSRRLLEFLLAPEVRRIQRSNSMSFGGSCLVAATKQ